MDGLLVIDKPEGLTSHDVVNRVRRILGTKKVGHTGTLDPFATGVMVVLVGRATRLAQFLDKDEKEYLAEVRFGFSTDTGDRTGTSKGDTGEPPDLSSMDWDTVLNEFRGTIEQVPPMYSAKKVEGKKLYELARQGAEIERQAVSVTISRLEVISVEGERARLRVACSAGTYIRVLGEEIGARLGVGAHLAELRRTRSGRFTLEEAISLEALAGIDDPAHAMLPITAAVAHLAAVGLTAERVDRTRNGLATAVRDPYETSVPIRMIGPDKELIAIGTYDAVEGTVKPKIVLV